MNRRSFLKSGALWVPPLFAIGRARGQALTLADPAMVGRTRPAETPAPSYLIEEDCEGGTTPSGWTDSGTVNWGNTAVVESGTYSLALDPTGTAATSNKSHDSQSTVYGFVAMRRGTVTGTARIMMQIREGTTERARIQFNNASFTILHGSASAVITATYNNTTWYYVWWSYSKGTGSDGVATITVGTTKTKADGASASTSAGTSTTNVDNLSLGPTSAIANMCYYDLIRVSTSEIGDNP